MAASSSSDIRWKYDVFINFRGEDTYDGFISHLYGALLQKQINTFIDAEELGKGDRLPELLTAIRESRLSLVVFSQNYALSTCCLKELVEILECSYTKHQIVVPIFYQVDPATVRKLKTSFAEAFAQHDLDSNAEMEEVQSWRSALTTATNISGWDARNYKDDAELIEEIVEDVSTKLRPFSSTSSKYDVFINFRGEDTRRGFVSHLYRALRQKSIDTYIDAKALRKGDPLSELLIAAQASKISLLVLSENYASSTYSLNELVKIWESKYTKNQIVLPIFYQVNPSDFRDLNTFAEAFTQHDLDSNAEVVRRWKDALSTTPHLPGWVSREFGNDAKLIEEIVKDVSTKLSHILSTSRKDKGFVGMDSHVHQMLFLLNPPGVQTNDIRVVGIWGMGGLGKTTIARAVYDEIAYSFEACCFLENVKEGFMKHGQLHMQTQLLSSISNNKVGSSDILDKGFQVMLNSLGQRKVLIVIDDVDKLEQIEALLGEQHSSFGDESRIIITTRDAQLLSRADATYRPKVLNDYEALELFTRYAFRTNELTGDYVYLSEIVTHHAQGLPLALKVLGAFLHNKAVRGWKYVLEKIRKIPQRGIDDVLKISFDGLDPKEENIFLDIACFFKGMDKDHATAILDSCGYYPHAGIRCLSWHGFPLKSLPSNCQFKNLVDIDMRYSCIERLWEQTQKLEKLKFIDLSYCLYLKETPDFTEMPNLEKLILQNCISLVKFHQSISTLTNLLLLNLSGCEKLEILASSSMQSLETLDLSGCSSLEMFPETLEVMKKLSYLNLSGSKIKELPFSIRNRTGLRILGL